MITNGRAVGSAFVRAARRLTTTRTAIVTSTTPATALNRRGSSSACTRSHAPATIAGTEPASTRVASQRSMDPSRQYRTMPAGADTMLNTRLVELTDTEVTPSTVTWNGTSRNAPDTPTGVQMAAAVKPTTT